jgi:hypothetical protein
MLNNSHKNPVQDHCQEILQEILTQWDTWTEASRTFQVGEAARAGCRDVIPLALQLLDSNDCYIRQQALRALGELRAVENRQVFIQMLTKDPVDDVKMVALVELDSLFPEKEDPEILSYALGLFDAAGSSPGLRLAAGAVMMYQLGIKHDSRGRPAWWDENNIHELEHPAILEAVQRTRKLIG